VAAMKAQSLPGIHLNTATDRLFVTTRTGMIQCVQPIGKNFPIAFELLDRKPVKKQKNPFKPAADKPGAEDVDPFAEEGPGDEKPKKEEDMKEDGDADPFG
jgi:hypothetical protein